MTTDSNRAVTDLIGGLTSLSRDAAMDAATVNIYRALLDDAVRAAALAQVERDDAIAKVDAADSPKRTSPLADSRRQPMRQRPRLSDTPVPTPPALRSAVPRGIATEAAIVVSKDIKSWAAAKQRMETEKRIQRWEEGPRRAPSD